MLNVSKRLFVLAAGSLFWAALASGSTFDDGDAARGKDVYAQCIACHSLDRHRTGPKHCGLIGRKAGAAVGFDYSQAMRASEVIWSAQTLDNFLFAPLAFMPGTKMGVAGVKNDADRWDLIAYLIAMNEQQECE